MKRDLISLDNFTGQEILQILDLAATLKKRTIGFSDHLKGKAIGLLFQKPSNRTRVSFEVGVYQLGGKCIYLSPQEINLGKRESTQDVAKTLSRYLDGIVARTNSHDDMIALGQHANVPVINGLSDLYHPCQALADLLSIKEHFGSLDDLTLAFVGDGNNVCNSLLLGCAKVGMNISVATPRGYTPDGKIVAQANSYTKNNNAKIVITTDLREAVKNANVVYTDVWVSMGQEEESPDRLKIFQDYQINAELMALAAKDHIFMHCLPAHRGQEVTADVIDGPNSIVFDQAENRLHAQKAVLITLCQ
ncbi:MAG: ornithine carbamoyltransferase [Candidatus Omnitrophica bacterium]|nr:ornithine carbamoyltransferase [Candidatus Omnitrophota bacterium]